jgi:hypothetical protein
MLLAAEVNARRLWRTMGDRIPFHRLGADSSIIPAKSRRPGDILQAWSIRTV